jgi:hypothetical protein
MCLSSAILKIPFDNFFKLCIKYNTGIMIFYLILKNSIDRFHKKRQKSILLKYFLRKNFKKNFTEGKGRILCLILTFFTRCDVYNYHIRRVQ